MSDSELRHKMQRQSSKFVLDGLQCFDWGFSSKETLNSKKVDASLTCSTSHTENRHNQHSFKVGTQLCSHQFSTWHGKYGHRLSIWPWVQRPNHLKMITGKFLSWFHLNFWVMAKIFYSGHNFRTFTVDDQRPISSPPPTETTWTVRSKLRNCSKY